MGKEIKQSNVLDKVELCVCACVRVCVCPLPIFCFTLQEKYNKTEVEMNVGAL